MKRKTKDEYIKKSHIIHNRKYDYSKYNFENVKVKSTIICPIHGEFQQDFDKHINGQMGCRKCGRIISANKQKFTTEEFVSTAKKIHSIFDYSKVNYINNSTKVEIICKKHGSFWQLPSNHIYHKRGCKKCATEINTQNNMKTTEVFIEEAKHIHKNKYDYSLVKYTGAFKHVIIICPIHGKFKQSPDNHLHGKECSKCSKVISKPEIAFLNYFEVPTRQFRINRYKIDGYNKNTNTIYEFLGDYYHGNLNIYDKDKINTKCKLTFGELYSRTYERFDKLKSMGYNIKYIWEFDWNKFTKGLDKQPNIINY